MRCINFNYDVSLSDRSTKNIRNDDNNFIIIVADTKLIGNFTIMFNDQQFLHFLSTNGIVEVQDDVILWDEYVEDDAGITHMNTHGIKVVHINYDSWIKSKES